MMETNTQMIERDVPPMVVQTPITPMQMLNTAVAQGADLDKLTKLMDLQERWEKGEAKKAFVAAMAAFKANPPTVYKDKENKQYNSMYTTIGNLVNTINASLSTHGLSARWDVDQATGIRVTCILTHRMGHSESTSMVGPADTSGSKNALQQIKSTVTYLKIATFEAITGTASAEGGFDDDGNAAKDKKPSASKSVAAAAWEALDDKVRSRLTDIAIVAKEHIADGDIESAVKCIDGSGIDADERVAIWSQFDSKARSAMKRAKQEMAIREGMVQA